MISLPELQRICPAVKQAVLETYIDHINATMQEFEISDTPLREAMFISQVAHESGGFRYVRELASGEAYEGRADLGNTEPGDGVRFKGRGLIQITGRGNYRECGDALGVDLIAQPELLETPALAARSAGWFWQKRGLNEIADKGDFKLVTKRINGGYNGYDDRLAYFNRATDVLT